MLDEDAYATVSVAVEDGIAEITLDRPEKYNALNDAAMLDLQRAFGEITLDRSIDAVVLAGEGEDAFSAGADIEQYAGPAADHDPMQKDRQDLFHEVYTAPREAHPPVIAKIDGYCVGGGLILASYCDIRIAAEGAEFGVPTCDIGQIPTGGSTFRLSRLVGEAKAKELVFTAGYVGAEEAGRIGLVNDVVPGEKLDEAVAGIVAAIQDTGREAVKASKETINRVTDTADPGTARGIEREAWWDQFATEERRRLVDEFNE
ncbi:MAG: enoyl-CoA hydratase/isomerase family protein [Haloarculaceae archaeon]